MPRSSVSPDGSQTKEGYLHKHQDYHGSGQVHDGPCPATPARSPRWQERLERLAAQHATAWAPLDRRKVKRPTGHVIAAEVPGLARVEVELTLQDNH